MAAKKNVEEVKVTEEVIEEPEVEVIEETVDEVFFYGQNQQDGIYYQRYNMYYSDTCCS